MRPRNRDLGAEYQQGIFDMLRGAKDFWLKSGMGLLNPNNPAYQYLKSPMPSGSLLDDPELVALSENLPMLDPSSVAGMTKVFHGSPHLFKNWDFSKMGSGEGAQAFGHGGYFASNKKIGEHYRDVLTDTTDGYFKYKSLTDKENDIIKDFYVSPDDDNSMIRHHVKQQLSKRDTLQDFNERLRNNQPTADEYGYLKKNGEIAFEFGEEGKRLYEQSIGLLNDQINTLKKVENINRQDDLVKNTGHLYEIELRPDPEDFPEYYTPISDQKNILKKYNDAYKRSKVATGEEKAMLEKALDVINPRLSIEDQYHHHKTRKNKKEWFPATVVSESLRILGIPGHKYLDATSRGNRSSKNFNYVVYPTDDPDMIKITNPPQSLLD